jgi:uncharacterized membrane protein
MTVLLFSSTLSLMDYRVLGTCLGLVIVLLLMLLELGNLTRTQRTVIVALSVILLGTFGAVVTIMQRSIR